MLLNKACHANTLCQALSTSATFAARKTLKMCQLFMAKIANTLIWRDTFSIVTVFIANWLASVIRFFVAITAIFLLNVLLSGLEKSNSHFLLATVFLKGINTHCLDHPCFGNRLIRTLTSHYFLIAPLLWLVVDKMLNL